MCLGVCFLGKCPDVSVHDCSTPNGQHLSLVVRTIVLLSFKEGKCACLSCLQLTVDDIVRVFPRWQRACESGVLCEIAWHIIGVVSDNAMVGKKGGWWERVGQRERDKLKTAKMKDMRGRFQFIMTLSLRKYRYIIVGRECRSRYKFLQALLPSFLQSQLEVRFESRVRYDLSVHAEQFKPVLLFIGWRGKTGVFQPKRVARECFLTFFRQ